MLQETSRTHNTLLLGEFYFTYSGFSQHSCCPCQGEQRDYQRCVPIFARLASVVAADTSTRWPATCINDTLTARLTLRLPLPSLQPSCSSPSDDRRWLQFSCLQCVSFAAQLVRFIFVHMCNIATWYFYLCDVYPCRFAQCNQFNF